MTELLIRNMVCRHCIEAVANVLNALNLNCEQVELGRAVVSGNVSPEQMAQVALELNRNGFELISDEETQLVERIKHLVLHHIREEKEAPHNLSECIERGLNISYDAASRAFSQHEGRTIEKYHIAQKIEYVKELLQHGQFTLSEIADMLDYSSVAHLSRQFKSVTGMTPSEYLRGPRLRRPLTDV